MDAVPSFDEVREAIVRISSGKDHGFEFFDVVPILRFKVRSTDAWRARRARAYNGGLVAEPPAESRGRAAESLVRGSGGQSPPEAESL